ncbi:MAG: electron transfer flavoprotein subunit alpha/FixB family protein [Desulfobacterales bacterium]|nr:electron transfer flavoprotein subunit alpha/FixB family protein [Desulfobacterales bacterium]
MILAVIETDQGKLAEASQQMLTFARDLAGRFDAALIAVTFEAADAALAREAGAFGAASLIQIRHERLDSYAPEAIGRAVVQIIGEKKPEAVLAASTDRGNEILAHAAAVADLPMASNCAEVRELDPFEITRLRWGSSLLEEARLEKEPKLMTVGLHVVVAEEASAPAAAEVEVFTPSLEDRDLRVRVAGIEEEVVEGISLKTAPVVIGGGRGVGSAEGYDVLEKLAELVGGAVGGSRVATNNGWRPHADQIGLTGNRIAPDLYIACGISGAIQHLVGCKGAKRILVINKDPEAPFFAKADWGVVGDLHEVIPAIIEEIKKR